MAYDVMASEMVQEILKKCVEERRRSERLLAERGRRLKAKAGGLNGCAPVGYVNRRRGDRTWVEVDPVMGPLVREAFGLAATKRYSLRRLCAIMAEKGLRSRNGKVVGPSAMRWMLNSAFYRGMIRHGNELLKGSHETLAHCGDLPASLTGRLFGSQKTT